MPTVKTSVRTQTRIERTHTIQISRSVLLAALQEAGIIETVPDGAEVYVEMEGGDRWSAGGAPVTDRPDEQIIIEWKTEDYEDSNEAEKSAEAPDPTPDSFAADDPLLYASGPGYYAGGRLQPRALPTPVPRTRTGTSRKPKPQ